jgi:hypothetical protein
MRFRIKVLYNQYLSVFPEEPILVIEKPICRKYAGADISNTAIWTGVFWNAWPNFNDVVLIGRQAVKMNLVGKKGNDSKIRDYLIKRFDQDSFRETKSGVWKLKLEGSKWFDGFIKDIWQAYALLVYFIDKSRGI